MHTYNLPRKYLSYSAIDLWLRSPAQFRKRYYERRETFMTPELKFGKHIADLLETNHDSLNHIRRYKKPEQPINIEIDGVPVFGFIDSFDPHQRRIIEFKTGVKPWDDERVSIHKQLDLYSLAIQEMMGSVHETTHLIWLQTEKCEPKTTGLISHEDSHTIRLTGEVHEFERVITQDEREAMRELLVQTAQEISDDYTAWQEENRPSGLIPK